MPYRAAIVTPWVAATDDPSDSPSNHPLLGDEYPTIRWSDITGQDAQNIPTKPNEYTLEVELEGDVLAAIELDPEYDVLWSEEIVDDAP